MAWHQDLQAMAAQDVLQSCEAFEAFAHAKKLLKQSYVLVLNHLLDQLLNTEQPKLKAPGVPDLVDIFSTKSCLMAQVNGIANHISRVHDNDCCSTVLTGRAFIKLHFHRNN